MLSYDNAITELLKLGHELAQTPAHKFDLANMRVLLQELGHPERRFASVLIAGTNGKGSTAALLDSILRAANFHTGLYTSPHLIRANERIQVDGEIISDVEFAETHSRVEQAAQKLLAQGALPWHPSFFEMLTAMAFEYFASAGVQIAVLEVGMGGRLDATNVVEPCISVITDISLDHQNFLGNTLREIAGEKAGIIRPRGVVVTLPQHPEANDVIGNTILERDARGVSAVPYVPPVSPGSQVVWAEGGSYPLTVLGEEICVELSLPGRHQLRNTALAIAAAIELKQFGFAVTPKQIEAGIRQAEWPGRFQILSATGGDPEIVLDVAHNPAGAWALRAALSQHYEGRPLIMIFGAMRDKAIGEMAEVLFPLADKVILTHAESPRAATPAELQQAALHGNAETMLEPSVESAWQRARALAGKGTVVVITGSIYIVGEALRILQGRH
ncbi:MAG TPA: folylpolyglutamate synthase/dihydrofolate synthase family protein [Terriglobales bacterium]|jgi:dihydrofolate synthase/folylpolyglutamate synthase|nr:folylpolyglutamate synthase/dihydrofolate synthase family protein [Terriglobales bacterium]